MTTERFEKAFSVPRGMGTKRFGALEVFFDATEDSLAADRRFLEGVILYVREKPGEIDNIPDKDIREGLQVIRHKDGLNHRLTDTIHSPWMSLREKR